MRRFAIIGLALSICAVTLVSSLARGADSTQTFQIPQGTWTGTGYQLYDMPSEGGEYGSWSVQLKSDRKSVGISYPSLACGGTWQHERSTPLASYFRETISYGREDCIDQGLAVASPMDDGRLRIEYYHPDGNFIAFAHLEMDTLALLDLEL